LIEDLRDPGLLSGLGPSTLSISSDFDTYNPSLTDDDKPEESGVRHLKEERSL